jgi:hypothetical protein
MRRIAVVAIAVLAVTACQPQASSSGSGGGQPAPPPAQPHGGGSHATSTTAGKGPLYNGDFDAVGDFQPGQRVNCADISYRLTIRATGTVKWRAFASTQASFPWRVIDEIRVEPNEGMLAPGQSATIGISGGITTILHPDFFYLTVEYANLPGAGHSYEFDCQGG